MADVNRLLDVMGVTEKLREGMEAALVSMRENLSAAGALTPEKWAAFEADIRSHSLAQLILEQLRDALTLTPEDMDQVIAFYESPKGKRIMEKMQLVNGAVDRAVQSRLEGKMKAAMAKVMGQ